MWEYEASVTWARSSGFGPSTLPSIGCGGRGARGSVSAWRITTSDPARSTVYLLFHDRFCRTLSMPLSLQLVEALAVERNRLVEWRLRDATWLHAGMKPGF